MSDISLEFNYEGTQIITQCNLSDKFEVGIESFLTKVGKSKEELYFIYGAKIINSDLKIISQINENDKKRNKMSIIVNDIVKEETKSLKKSQYIICPKCKENAIIAIENYRVRIHDCRNGHNIDNILIENFEKTQMIDESKIICQICNKNNKNNTYNNTFYICLDCNIKICPLCKLVHDKSHNIIDLDDNIFTCHLHNDLYFSFCKKCQKDICLTCESEHNGHKIIGYGSIIPDIKKMKKEANIFNQKKEKLKNDINSIINKLNNLAFLIDNYFKIYEDIINSYENKRRNYFLLQNIKNMKNINDNILQDINKIINEINIYSKFNYMINIYNNITQLENKQQKEKNDIKNEFEQKSKKNSQEEIKNKTINTKNVVNSDTPGINIEKNNSYNNNEINLENKVNINSNKEINDEKENEIKIENNDNCNNEEQEVENDSNNIEEVNNDENNDNCNNIEQEVENDNNNIEEINIKEINDAKEELLKQLKADQEN